MQTYLFGLAAGLLAACSVLASDVNTAVGEAAPPAGSTAERGARGLIARMMAERANARASVDWSIPECVRLPAPEGAEMPMACFDAKLPPSWEVQQMVNAAMMPFADRYQLGSRWSGTQGSPRALTWSFVPDGLSISSGVGEPVANSTLFASMDAKFAGVGGRAVWIAQFQACFDRWATLTGLSYTRVTSGGNPWDDGAVWGTAGAAGARGDVRISMKNIDGGSNVLAYNSFPSNGDMVLDVSENWQSGSPSFLFLRNTIMHEHGHGIGLAHVCPIANTKLMEPFLSTSFDGPQQDEIRGASRQYGDAYESNETAATATVLASVGVGTTLNPSTLPAPAVANGSLTGLAGFNDVDWYRFDVATPIIGTITVTPLGNTYADLAQTQNCNETTPTTNSLALADLALEFYNSTGATLINSSTAGAVGVGETLSNVLFSPPGNLNVRVFASNSPTQTQLYRLTITGGSAPTITASDAAFSDRVQLNWTAITGAVTYNVFRGTTNVRGAAGLLSSPVTNSLADMTAVPGTTYFYWVEVNTGAGGSRPVAGPDAGSRQIMAAANDACANAIAVTSGSVTAGTLVGATNDAAGSCGTSTTNPDVWYSFAAPACAGTLVVSTCGSSDTGGVDLGTDTVLSLYSACGGTELACNDDATGAAPNNCSGLDGGLVHDSYLSRAMAAGESVRIRVSRFGATTGTEFTLRVTFSIANDLCSGAAAIGSGTAIPFCNVGANTDGPSEALCNFFGNDQITNDLWYAYTAPTDGRFTVATCASGFDTKVAVYPGGCPVATGTALACNDDACGTGGTRSQASAVGVTGTPYLIRVGGFNGATGSGVLTVYCAADVNLSGVVSVQDIFDLLAFYFANDPRGDFNGTGVISVQDLFDFLKAYFTGCA